MGISFRSSYSSRLKFSLVIEIEKVLAAISGKNFFGDYILQEPKLAL